MHVTICTMAAGERYLTLAQDLAASLHHLQFPHELVWLWKSNLVLPAAVKPALILSALQDLRGEYIFFLDADMRIVEDLALDDLAGELVGVEHFFPQAVDYPVPESLAHVPDRKRWWQTCLFGGERDAVLSACREAARLIRQEGVRGQGSGVRDEEAYLNKVFHERADIMRTLPPNFATPTDFDRWPASYRQSYEQLAGNAVPKILHGNASAGNPTR